MSRIPYYLPAPTLPEAFKHHLALFSDESTYVTVASAGYDDEGNPIAPDWIKNYTQVSEWVEVTFPVVSTEEYVRGQLKTLDEAEKETTAKYLTALERLKTKRAELLAITHQE